VPTRYDALFGDYVRDLRSAHRSARAWWADLIRKDGETEVRRRWPAGPAAHPRIIAVLRKYWFACEALNREVEAGKGRKDEEEVYPFVFLGEQLLDGKNDELGEFLDDLKYWPLGLDAEDNYV
jgi:hypothetical protein